MHKSMVEVHTDNDEERGEGGLSRGVVAGIVVAIIAIVTLLVLTQKRKFEPVVAGTQAIDFTLPDLDGREVSLKDYRGKVVFLNFWATWCKPCEDEMPSMQSLYNALKDKPFEILAVSVDSEGPEVVRKFVERYNLTFPVLHDRRGRVKEEYKTTGVPETFIIDQNGVIAEKIWGPRDWSNHTNIGVILDLLENGPRNPEDYKR